MQINLEKVVLPQLKEYNQKNTYYLPNIGDTFFAEMLSFYDNSSLHGGIIDNKVKRIYGSGLQGDTPMDNDLISGLSLNDHIAKMIYDFELYNGFAILVNWNILHTKIIKIEHIPFDSIRVGMIGEDLEPSLYYYSNEWNKNRNRTVIPIAPFSVNPNTPEKQLYYFKNYHPGSEIYPRPPYYSLLNWIYTDIELGKYYSTLVKNNFVSNAIISMNNGIPSDPAKEAFEKSIKKHFTGSENAGSVMVIYNDHKDNAPEIVKFNNESDDQKYQFLMSQTTEKIVSGHQIPNPLLAGIKSANALGSSGEELKIAETIYNDTVIHPRRETVITNINYLNTLFLTPIKYTISDKNIFTDENKQ